MKGTPPVSSVWAFEVTSFGHVGVVLDAGEEGGGEGGHQDRAGQGGADGDAEVGERVLEPADLAALLVGQRRDGHGAELRCECTDAEAGEDHRPRGDLGAGALVERSGEHDETEEQREEPELGDQPR